MGSQSGQTAYEHERLTVPVPPSSAFLPLCAPVLAGSEHTYLSEVLASRHWAGGGPFSGRCERLLEADLGAGHAMLTPSCTAALEMCALLAELADGDEVIMPSFTFPSTANAVTLRGATPVFVDIDAATLNIDPRSVEAAITARTRAILVVHYAGVCCDMDAIAEIAKRHSLIVIEDAAQAYLSEYRGRRAGTLGDMAAFSFHETKNLGCGEGGAFVTSSPELAVRAEIIREKGTNRSEFMRGEVQKYTWVAMGSSYLPSEFQAAVLLAQLERAAAITTSRLELWNRYHASLADLAKAGYLRLPIIPSYATHNGQIYWIMLSDREHRDRLLAALRGAGIGAAFHYVPLHLAREGQRVGTWSGDLRQTTTAADRLLRLPLNACIQTADVDRVVHEIDSALRGRRSSMAFHT